MGANAAAVFRPAGRHVDGFAHSLSARGQPGAARPAQLRPRRGPGVRVRGDHDRSRATRCRSSAARSCWHRRSPTPSNECCSAAKRKTRFFDAATFNTPLAATDANGREGEVFLTRCLPASSNVWAPCATCANRRPASGWRSSAASFDDAKLGDSIAINGCCLTVVARAGRPAGVRSGARNLSRTNLGELVPGEPVNLEPSLRVGDRLGGHFVTGHVEGLGTLADAPRRARLVDLLVQLSGGVGPLPGQQGIDRRRRRQPDVSRRRVGSLQRGPDSAHARAHHAGSV